MASWRLLSCECSNPRFNLSIEESIVRLFDSSGCDGVLRLWCNSPSVIVSYSQDAKREVDLEFCEAAGIEVVRRLSGGGAVYHDMGVVNISLTVNIRKYKELTDIESTYKVIARPLVILLKNLNIDVKFKAPNGVFINDLKVAGFAQYRSQNTLLVHGSMLFNANLDNLRRSLLNLKYEVANISSVIGERLNMEMFKDEVIHQLSKMFNVELIETPLTSREVALASKLYILKYSNPSYNLSRAHPNAVASICLPTCPTAKYEHFYEDILLKLSRLYRDVNLVIKRCLINSINIPLVHLDGEPLRDL